MNADPRLPFKDESPHGELKVSQRILDTNVKIVRDHLSSVRFYFGGAPKSLQMVTAAMKLKDAYFLEEKL